MMRLQTSGTALSGLAGILPQYMPACGVPVEAVPMLGEKKPPRHGYGRPIPSPGLVYFARVLKGRTNHQDLRLSTYTAPWCFRFPASWTGAIIDGLPTRRNRQSSHT